jgi:hypothetical protein
MPKHSSHPKSGTPSARWAENEFATLVVKDPRRVKRWRKMATDFHALPGASIPQASGSWAASKACYRLVESRAISPECVFQSHCDATVRRIDASSEEQVLLVAQDTTTLNFSSRPNTKGLGPIGNKADTLQGIFVHGSLCLGARSGNVFGLLGAEIWARDAAQFKAGPAGARNRKPIEEKESHRWLESWRKADALYHRLGGRHRVVSVADREGDIYEAFALCLQSKAARGGGADLLVRSQHNRKKNGGPQPEQGSWQHVENLPMAARIKVAVPRSAGKPARSANLELRYAKMELKAPAHKTKYLGLDEPLVLWLVVAKEVAPPDGVEAVCWRVWTTVEIGSGKQAEEIIGWYAKRWMIEELHRILKSGCKVEERQLDSIEKLSLVLALDLIVASYLLGLSKAAREQPGQAVSAWLGRDQWQALYCYTHKTNDLPPDAPSLKNAVDWIARLGGFLNRKRDGPPGAQVLWRGMRRLEDITEAYRIFRNQGICG